MARGIRYISFLGPNGYGNAARNYLLGLHAADFPVTWTPLRPGFRRFPHHRPFSGRSVATRQLDPLCNRPLEYDTVLLHVLPEYIPTRAGWNPESGWSAIASGRQTACPSTGRRCSIGLTACWSLAAGTGKCSGARA